MSSSSRNSPFSCRPLQGLHGPQGHSEAGRSVMDDRGQRDRPLGGFQLSRYIPHRKYVTNDDFQMPGPVDTRGLQLWVNLAKEFKMVEPAYQEHTSEGIPKGDKDGVTVKGQDWTEVSPQSSYRFFPVIAGESMGIKSPVRTRTPTYFLDFRVAPDAKRFVQDIPDGWTTFAYTLEGALLLGKIGRLIFS
jgi:redox-sensitive bicupin YhaK (pirin superfamily)